MKNWSVKKKKQDNEKNEWNIKSILLIKISINKCMSALDE